MRRVHVAILILLVISLIGAACANSSKQTKSIGTSDSGKTVTLSVGDTLNVTLEGNPTTGYNWEAQSLDTTILKQVGQPTFTPTSSAIGSGGQITLSFEAAGKGQTTLNLIYHRSFETGVAPLHTYQVTVQVN